MNELLVSFEGQIRNLVKDCVIISHYHSGVDYNTAFELSPYERQIIADFVEEEHAREMKLNNAFLGIKRK